jgi:hypothetical protein
MGIEYRAGRYLKNGSRKEDFVVLYPRQGEEG